MKKILIFYLCFMFIVLSIQAYAKMQYMVWQKAPIAITLPVGKVKMVSFPEPIAVGINRKLLPKTVLHIDNDHQTIYFTAHQAFATQN